MGAPGYRRLMSCLAIIRIRGNRDTPSRLDIGRDRVVVTWMNADQTQSTDHLDIRYCKQ